MAAEIQQDLLNVLPLGVWHFPQAVSAGEQVELREAIRQVVRKAPLTIPKMPGGTDFNLKITSCGSFGWSADGKDFYYAQKQPTGRAWPAIPPQIMSIARKAAQEAGLRPFEPNSCLVSYYEAEKGSLGRHRDDTKGEDLTQPVVSISLGDTALFGIGGEDEFDRMREIALESGDVFVLGAGGRLLYHRVSKILKGTSQLLQNGGRISLTLRRVKF